MKALIILFTVTVLWNPSHAQVGPPNPPQSICYDYDKAGNRIAQTPEWISLDPNIASILCTPNNPETYLKPRRIFIFDYRNRILYPDEIYIISVKVKKTPIYAMAREVPQLLSEGGQIVELDYPILNTVTENDEVYYTTDEDLKSTQKQIDLTEISIVPNPNIGKFRIEQKGFDTDYTEITIMDTKGRILFIRDFINGEVNVGEFAAGVYILSLKDRTHQRSVRFEKRM
jgi:hypothetical protein